MKSANPVALFTGNRAVARSRHELEFLPAAIEILETPPSPVGRATLLVVCLLLAGAVAWSWMTQIDITATAPGKIVPSGKSKSVQPFSTGVVRAIHVDDGKKVSAGDVLIEFDPTISDAEAGRVEGDLFALKMEMARLRAALAAADGGDPSKSFHPPEGADPRLVNSQLQLLLSQASEHRAKLIVLDRQISQKRSDLAAVGSTIGKNEALLPILRQQLDMRKTLFDQGYGSRVTYLEVLQQYTGLQKDLIIQKDNQRTAEAALEATIAQRSQLEAEHRRMLSDTLAADQAKVAALEQDLIKAREMSSRQVLKAPVDGVVQQLAIHTIGGVVTPAQTLMVIVPVDNHLEIEAMVSNTDIGFVRPGQEAQIKIGTFDFTRYGMLRGEVVNVSADAVTPQQLATTPGSSGGPDRGQSGQVASTVSAQTMGAVYSARISVERMHMDVDGKPVNLSPGMTVTAEIKTGTRTIMDYVISSVRRHADSAMRER